jgi:hypothetical protein
MVCVPVSVCTIPIALVSIINSIMSMLLEGNRFVLVRTVKDTALVIVQDGMNSLTRMFFVDEVT